MSSEHDWLRSPCDPGADPAHLIAVAVEREAAGDHHNAATAYDLAYGLDPTNDGAVAGARAQLLDRLEVVEYGLRFRYVPGGTFLMGSETGDPDEKPVHAVELEPFWVSDTPVSWADYCRLLDWTPPPEGMPKDPPPSGERINPAFISIFISNQIRLQYCETETTGAIDWHAHHPSATTMRWGPNGEKTSKDLYGELPRRNPQAPWTWDRKPMVAMAWQDAQELGERLSSPVVRYGLPSEAEREKAARGGLVGCQYSWGNEPPTRDRCDCDRWNEFSIRPPRELPPNGYGLYGICGGVWEWTADRYDAGYYRESPRRNPTGPDQGEERVLRGGSWTDCAEAVTVSFRMSRGSSYRTPNLGFRLVRRDAGSFTTGSR